MRPMRFRSITEYCEWLAKSDFMGGGVSNASQYLGNVCTNTGRVNMVLNTSAKQVQSISYHRVMEDIPAGPGGLKVAYAHWYIPVGSLLETAVPGTSTFSTGITKGGLAGTTTQALWAGAATINKSGDGYTTFSDGMSVGYSKGDTILVRSFMENATNTVYSQFAGPPTFIDTANSEQTRFAVSGMTDQTAANGALTGGTAATDFIITPALMVGNTRAPTVMICGDSIPQGIIDPYDGTATGDRGIIARSLGQSYAYGNFGRGSDTLAKFKQIATDRVAAAAYFSHVIIYLGVNSIQSGVTGSTAFNDLNTIVGYFTAIGKDVTICTIMGVSTGSWGSIAAQTPSVHLADFTTFNNSIRAGSVKYIEISDQLSSARNSCIWIPSMTSDGTHPNTAGNLLVQSSGVVNPRKYVR